MDSAKSEHLKQDQECTRNTGIVATMIEEIEQRKREVIQTGRPFLVAIAGIPGVGKSVCADGIRKLCKDVSGKSVHCVCL